MKRLALIVIVTLLLFGCQEEDAARLKGELRTGDVIFQTLPNELSQVICEVTQSPISHCGMIIREKGGDVSVIEAVGPVRIIPLESFVSQGIGGKFAVIRLKDKSFDDFDGVVTEAKKFLGRPYDIQYRFDDEYIYCSELVYKAYYNAAKLKIARLVKLGDLDYKGNVDFIKDITGGTLPLDREMVTPADVYDSDKFVKIFSNYTN